MIHLSATTRLTPLVTALLFTTLLCAAGSPPESGPKALARFRKTCNKQTGPQARHKGEQKLIPCVRIHEEEKEKHGLSEYGVPAYTADQKIALWNQVEGIATDKDIRTVDSWQFVGPDVVGSYSGSNGYVTGRINAMEYMRSGNPASAKLIIGSASGGVWTLNNNAGSWQPQSLHGNLNNLNVGHITQRPDNDNEFMLGTGEEAGSSGTGMYKTINGGTTWQAVNWPGSVPGYFTKIVYDKDRPDTVHAASNLGYYRSTDGGNTWSLQFTGIITDLAVNPAISYHIVLYDANTGLQESSNYGDSFTPIAGVPFNPTNTGNVKLSFAQSTLGRLYANVSQPSGLTLGIFRSNNAGASWTQCPVLYNGNNIEFHYQQGHYNNCIAVDPLNENFVLAGGGALVKSTDGTNFNLMLFSQGYHADVHAIVYNETSSDIFIATDGGIYHSTDGAATFNPSYNRVPVTQFYDIDVAGNNLAHIVGSTQDNGTMMAVSSGSGYQWTERSGSDGWNSARSDNQPNDAVAINGFPAENAYLLFTGDAGNTWNVYTDPAGCASKGKYVAWERSNAQQWPYIDAAILACGDGVYYRDLFNALVKMNSTAFAGDAIGVAVSNRSTPSANNNIYIPIINGGAVKMMKRDRTTGNFVDISVGLIQTAGEWYRVFTHAVNFDEAYALPTSTPGKVFRTTDAGNNWIDVSGNLPPVSLMSVTGHPTNPQVIIAGSAEYGIFRTDDGGSNWYRWENGLPKGISVTQLEAIDSSAWNGKAYVVAGTYGRGVWQRDFSGEEPSNVIAAENNPDSDKLISSAGISQSLLNIRWQTGDSGPVQYYLSDMGGKVIVSGEASGTATSQSLRNCLPGIYLLQATRGKRTETVKLFVTE